MSEDKTMRRFFGKMIDGNIRVDGSEFNHIKKVLRMKEGDELIVYTNDEFEYTCQISNMSKDFCNCKITHKQICPALPQNEITLFQMMPKKEYFDNIIPKAIELGVSEIYFFTSEFTMIKSFKRERVDMQVMTSCKQCERSKLVQVHDVIKFEDMTKMLKNYDLIIFAYENETNKFDPKILENKQKIAVIIGNEAGFSEKEASILKKEATSISLGSRILRCDTAVTATLALVGILSGN